jgi:hypothetical protein
MQEDELTPQGDSAVEEPEIGVQAGQDTEPSRPGRLGRIARLALRWAAGVGLVFLGGVLVTFFWRVRPQADTIRRLQTDLNETQSQVNKLQARLDELAPLESENEQLQQEMATKDRHLDLLDVLVDVTRAQLALAQDQAGEAKSALGGTDASLQSLHQGLDGRQADIVAGMRERLQLAMTELDGDTFAAQRDLEIMANNLVDLEAEAFGD